MKQRLRREWLGFKDALQSLDTQTAVVLTLYVVFVIAQFKLGSHDFFRARITADAPEIVEWAWWFGAQGVTGFVLPAALLILLFRRRWTEIGLSLGDWKTAGIIGLLFLPGATIVTWVLSDGPAFQAQYPHLRAAVSNWELFFLYHLLFLFYWIGWEYLWRGFMLFGTAQTLGYYAIFIQAIPFALLHLRKPFPELFLSIVGGLALGAVVWRCRSFWIAVPIHAAQMFLIDFWCTLRLRSGISGITPRDFIALLEAWLSG